MGVNEWYKPVRELTPEELTSPWIVTDYKEVTPERIKAFLAAAGKSYSGDMNEFARRMQVAWIGHLLDWSVPRKNGAVLLDHLVAFMNKYSGAVDCFMALSPSAQPQCFLSRLENTPVIVYGHRCLAWEKEQWAVLPGIEVEKLKPMADFAFKNRFPEVSNRYIATLRKISDVRIVVAIDKAYYDKDMGIVERLNHELLRPVIISLGEHNAASKQSIAELNKYREAYICEEDTLIPACIGKSRAVFVSDNRELCESLIVGGVKVVSVGFPCPNAVMSVEQGHENEITSEAVLQRFIRAGRSS